MLIHYIHEHGCKLLFPSCIRPIKYKALDLLTVQNTFTIIELKARKYMYIK